MNRRQIGRPFKKGQGGRPKGALNKATVEKNLMTRMQPWIDGQEYFDNVKGRIIRGRAPHAESHFLRVLYPEKSGLPIKGKMIIEWDS